MSVSRSCLYAYNATIRWRWIRTIDKRIEKMWNNRMGFSTKNRSYHYHVQRRLALLKIQANFMCNN